MYYVLKETELCTFCTETKESLLHLLWECTYNNTIWFSLVNVFENCGLNMQYINAPNIILGIMDPLDPDNTKNQVILIFQSRCNKLSLVSVQKVHSSVSFST
jgi:hypothetical protein